METLEKFNDQNFHTEKVKIQMQLMNKYPRELIKETKQLPIDPNKLLEWIENDKAKSIFGIGLSNLELHHLGLETSLKEMWDI